MSLINDRRAASLAKLRDEKWDVLIVGGGINGAGIARDLMLREAGLKVALVEKNHFSSGTSGRNSQLIHGGLRYLKYFDFGLVSDALHERATLLNIAPGLVEPLEFLIPCYSAFDRWFYQAGLLLYDALAGSQSIRPNRALNADQTSALEPKLDRNGLNAGLLFLDGKVNSARLVIENVLDAETRGACVMNYAELLSTEGKLSVRDTLTGQQFPVGAKKIVDATGAWSSEAGSGAKLRLVRGSHLVYPRIQQGCEAIAHFDELGRIIFFIPWGENDDLTLVGTTDVDHTEGPDHVRISEEEKSYLKAVVRRLFPSFDGEPLTSYSSLRPLISESGRSATATSREHRIWETANGTLHISGGKYTTYREMSEELVDTLLRDMVPGRDLPCRTAETRLATATPPKAMQERVRMAVEREYACKLEDLLYISTYWGHERHMTQQWLEPIAREMGALLGWTETQTESAVADSLAHQGSA